MGSTVAVAFQHRPDTFMVRFQPTEDPEEPGYYSVGGLPVLFGKDFVEISTLHGPGVTIGFALAEVERAAPGLAGFSKAVAVGLGGGEPTQDTLFDEWAGAWVRGDALLKKDRSVTEALFGPVADQVGISKESSDWLDTLEIGDDGKLTPKS